MRIAADAIWAPGGDRPRSGPVVLVFGSVVRWQYQKQTGVALVVHEAELNRAVTGVDVGMIIQYLVIELCDEVASRKIDRDNMATITTTCMMLLPGYHDTTRGGQLGSAIW